MKNFEPQGTGRTQGMKLTSVPPASSPSPVVQTKKQSLLRAPLRGQPVSTKYQLKQCQVVTEWLLKTSNHAATGCPHSAFRELFEWGQPVSIILNSSSFGSYKEIVDSWNQSATGCPYN
jgi:hypothetical protein